MHPSLSIYLPEARPHSEGPAASPAIPWSCVEFTSRSLKSRQRGGGGVLLVMCFARARFVTAMGETELRMGKLQLSRRGCGGYLELGGY